MNNDSTVYVGLDVHKDSIAAAYAIGLGEVESLGAMGVLDRDIDRLCTRMQSKGSRVSFVYEAGPCGYGLYRHLAKKGFACMVCAPSMIARKPGDSHGNRERTPASGWLHRMVGRFAFIR